MKFALTLTLSTLLLVGCTAESKMLEPSVPVFDKLAMDTLLSESIETGEHVGVSALVFDEGKTVYSGAFGFADRERNVPMEMNTVFRIYSMTKPITSAIIMDLAEDGKLSLEDPASKYIPELADMQVMSMGEDGNPVLTPQINPMTIEDLLLHRSGLGYGIFGDVNPIEAMYAKAKLGDPSVSVEDRFVKLSKLPLIAQPGEGWYYSLSTDVLGHIAEVIEGKRLGEIMDERIFDPLGMDETGFSVRPDQKNRFATTYYLQDDGAYIVAEDAQSSAFLRDNPGQSGGGGLVGTLGDYAKFAQMMLDGGIYDGHRVLEEDTVKAMMTNQMDPDDKFLMPGLGGDNNSGFGYGGSVELTPTRNQIKNSGRFAGQWGWGGAARTHFWIDPQNEAFGIIMLQYFGQQDPALHKQFRALALKQTRDDIVSK